MNRPLTPTQGYTRRATATTSDGYPERGVALSMLRQQLKIRIRRITVYANKAYDSNDFIDGARKLNLVQDVTKSEHTHR